MANERLKERFQELELLARAAGLDPYDVHFFEVPASLIYEVASYGLPTRYSHWSFGKAYSYQRTQGEMGFSKIYELILNSDPSFAFLDNSNPDTINLLIAAHCQAHSDFFKNNILFRECGETDMINVAKRHADIIDQFRNDYGDDEVDEWLDVALALERHIDVYRGLKRERYASRHIEYKERSTSPWEDIVDRKPKPPIKKVMEGIYLPPHPEKDLVWFLSEYSNLEPWQQKIFQIVRRESYYFYPQHRTKILNEGWASYWHAELMQQYSLGSDNDYGVPIKYPLTAEEHLDFAAAHEKVVQPGLKFKLKVEIPEIDRSGRPTGKKIKAWNPVLEHNPGLFSKATRLNPYYVGFKMLRSIKATWDEYFEQGYREDEWGAHIPVSINGNQKIREVMMEEDDVSFFRNYLTDELCEELHLFTYGNSEGYDDNYGFQEESSKQKTEGSNLEELNDQMIKNKTIQVQSKETKEIIAALARDRSNYGVPQVVVRRIDESGTLRLEHVKDEKINLDIKYAENVIRYVYKVWGRPVELIRKDKDKTWTMTYDGLSFEIGHEALDYPECLEVIQSPSSW